MNPFKQKSGTLFKPWLLGSLATTGSRPFFHGFRVGGSLISPLTYWLKTQLFNFWASYKVVYSESFNFYSLGFWASKLKPKKGSLFVPRLLPGLACGGPRNSGTRPPTSIGFRKFRVKQDVGI